jgi:FMN-dependent NADH-azoreductase
MTILSIQASARTTRSLSRRLSQLFIDTWAARRPEDRVIVRDLAADPPPHIGEAWIAASFTPPESRDACMRSSLAWSNAAIDEIEAADLILLGVPMYNYGMPSALKAWFDQVIRVGRTFSFDLSRGDWPLEPILKQKRLVVLSSRGEFGFSPGGVRERFNQLDPHIATCSRYLGVVAGDLHTIAIEFQEFGDARHACSIASAEAATVALALRLADDPAPGRAPDRD